MRLVVVKCSFIVGIEMYIFDRAPAASDILWVDFEASLVLYRCIAMKFLNIVYIKESFPLRKTTLRCTILSYVVGFKTTIGMFYVPFLVFKIDRIAKTYRKSLL